MEQLDKVMGFTCPLKELCGSIFYDVNYQKDFNTDSLVDRIMTDIDYEFSKLVIDSEFKFCKTILRNMLIFGVVNFHDMFRNVNDNPNISHQFTEIVIKHFQHPDISLRSLSFEIYDFPRDN